MPRPRNAPQGKSVEAIRHEEARRANLPSAEHQPLMLKEEQSPVRVAYERRNPDLDPQLVWRGKDTQNWSDLVVNAPPLYIQERVHPKALVADLMRQSKNGHKPEGDSIAVAKDEAYQTDMFADFNGLPEGADRTDFYQHDANWSNRMILGDSLQVMASLAEREGLQGKVQCIYIDPPYGIRFNSNFQWSTTSRDVRDGNRDHITREPEQVKAFRDTWRDGVHSYLTYLRDRLTVARDLLTDSGSVFVQIGDENVHRVRTVMDEVFGANNFVSEINFQTMTPLESGRIESVFDHILWYAKNQDDLKYRNLYNAKPFDGNQEFRFRRTEFGFETVGTSDLSTSGSAGIFKRSVLESSGFTPSCMFHYSFEGRSFFPRGRKSWRTNESGMRRLDVAGRLFVLGSKLYYKLYYDDFSHMSLLNNWPDTVAGYGEAKTYVVQTHPKVVQRCILMATDPGDLILDPTCGSGTGAYVAEQWGRRWITIDTSKVALALARARVMGARYPYYLLADSREGQLKEGEVSRRAPSEMPTYGNVRQGFVYQRVPHITLRDIANNAEIDVIWEEFQKELEPLRQELNRALDTTWEEWEIPRDAGDPWPEAAAEAWHRLRLASGDKEKGQLLNVINRELGRAYTLDGLPEQPRDPWEAEATALHSQWWEKRIARQKEIDKSIAAHAEFEYLYDKPYEDNSRVRVAGPFTVESISPHRTLEVDENGDTFDRIAEPRGEHSTGYDFGQVMLENLKRSGVQQAHKEDRISFTSLTGWPGRLVCAEGRYMEGGSDDGGDDGANGGVERRAAVFIGPEFGTVSRPDLVEAAREAADADFDVLIACAFNYDAHSTEFEKLGRIPVLKARMNADLHMADNLKNTGNGNLFVIFGEPDIDILDTEDGQLQVRVNGVDVFHPNSGEVRSDGPEGIACWFIDTDYDQESFFVRHAYFLGAGDPYKSLKTTLKAEINEDAWASLYSTASRPFPKPESGRIAVKVINHLGDEVMKVFRVG